tara:strand:- start:1626 stop:1907 length:282 start_codon:yes stop_codon:yes gene_type:complete
MYIVKYTAYIDEEAMLMAPFDCTVRQFIGHRIVDGEAEMSHECPSLKEVKEWVHDLMDMKAAYPKHWLSSDGVRIGGIKVFKQLTIKEMDEIK